MVWTWNTSCNNYMWTQRHESMTVTIRSCHANYSKGHEKRYTVGNFEYKAVCDYCHLNKKPGRYGAKSSYVSVKLRSGYWKANLHFACDVCKNGDVVTITLNPMLIMELADDRWDKNELARHLSFGN